MQWENDFYSVLDWQSDAGLLSCKIGYRKDHDIFQGHFPGRPIVPGVCTMEMVMHLLERAVDSPLALDHAPGVKFLGLITPDLAPQIHITWTVIGRDLVANAILSDGVKTLFKMSAVYHISH